MFLLEQDIVSSGRPSSAMHSVALQFHMRAETSDACHVVEVPLARLAPLDLAVIAIAHLWAQRSARVSRLKPLVG